MVTNADTAAYRHAFEITDSNDAKSLILNVTPWSASYGLAVIAGFCA